MVTSNIATDPDITNRARGTIVDIILNPQKPPLEDVSIVELKHLPQQVLVKLNHTRVTRLGGLDDGVIPDSPTKSSMQIARFTDYRSQGQMIPCVIIDIVSPHRKTLIVRYIHRSTKELWMGDDQVATGV